SDPPGWPVPDVCRRQASAERRCHHVCRRSLSGVAGFRFVPVGLFLRGGVRPAWPVWPGARAVGGGGGGVGAGGGVVRGGGRGRRGGGGGRRGGWRGQRGRRGRRRRGRVQGRGCARPIARGGSARLGRLGQNLAAEAPRAIVAVWRAPAGHWHYFLSPPRDD